jgi:hypothetical protein
MHLISSAFTNFIVTEDATPTPTLTPLPTPTPTTTPTQTLTPTVPRQALKGKIVFDYVSYQSSRSSGGGELDKLTKACIPEVSITPDGVISGDCEVSGNVIQLTFETVTAHITGIAVQGGSFNFTYDVVETGPVGSSSDPSVIIPNAVWEVHYTGSGNFTSPNTASGIANFNYACNSHYEYDFWCNDMTQETFSGTIGWSFVPSP